MPTDINSIAISIILSVYSCCIIVEVSKNKVINLLKYADLSENSGHYKILTVYFIKLYKEVIIYKKL